MAPEKQELVSGNNSQELVSADKTPETVAKKKESIYAIIARGERAQAKFFGLPYNRNFLGKWKARMSAADAKMSADGEGRLPYNHYVLKNVKPKQDSSEEK